MEWDEFTNFIIEKATVLNNIKTKLDEIKSYTLSNTHLTRKFQNLLPKIIYIPDIDRIAFFEETSDEIFLMNHETGVLNLKPLKVHPETLYVETTTTKKDEGSKTKRYSFLED